MQNPEKYKPSERGTVINYICSNALDMVIRRLVIENAGELELVDLPYCEENDAILIEEFIPRAKEGFTLALKTDWLRPSEIKKLVEGTSPGTPNVWRNIKLKERENTLPEWKHVLASLVYLSKQGVISFDALPGRSPISSYELSSSLSHWYNESTSPETLWNLMAQLEKLTRKALYSHRYQGNENLLKLGHFFAVGKEMSKIFSEK